MRPDTRRYPHAKLLCGLLPGLLLAVLPARAAEPTADAAAAGAAPAEPAVGATANATQRPALLAPTATLSDSGPPQDPRSLGPDEWREVPVGGRPVRLLHRAPAQAQATGTALIVSHRSYGADSATRAARLRTGLARHGYHTYLLAVEPLASERLALLPDAERAAQDAELAGRVQAASEYVRSSHAGEGAAGATFANLLISEGASGRWLRNWDAQGLTALVFVDVPEPARRADNWLLAATLPTLLIQTRPYYWSPEQPLGSSTELHLLPRQANRPPPRRGSSARPGEGLVLRNIRGWVQRLLTAPASSRS